GTGKSPRPDKARDLRLLQIRDLRAQIVSLVRHDRFEHFDAFPQVLELAPKTSVLLIDTFFVPIELTRDLRTVLEVMHHEHADQKRRGHSQHDQAHSERFAHTSPPGSFTPLA